MSNKQGSALIWAVALMLVLMIFLANGVAMSFRGYNRTITAKNYQQAELTAKSIASVATQYSLQKCEDDINYCVTFTNTSITPSSLPVEMGTINSIFIELVEGDEFTFEFMASVQATYNQERASVQVNYRITNTSGDNENPVLQMQILGYE